MIMGALISTYFIDRSARGALHDFARRFGYDCTAGRTLIQYSPGGRAQALIAPARGQQCSLPAPAHRRTGAPAAHSL